MKRSTKTTPRPSIILNQFQLSREGLMWLGASIIVGFLGWFKSINVVFLLAYFMLCILFLNGYLAFINARRVRVTREPALPIHAGEETIVRLTVTNLSPRSATVIVEDQIADGTVGWVVPDLPGRISVSCHARRAFAKRGCFPALPRVSSGFPIGLISFTRPADSGEVTVLPAVGIIDSDGLRRWIRRQAGANDLSRRVLRLATTDHADVRGVRPYRPGDQIRSIHWRMSAHRKEYMVREYDTSPAPDLILVVEPWLPSSPTPRQLDNFEGAFSLAATIIATWSRLYGTRVTLFVAGDPDSMRTTAPSERGVREAMIPLAHIAGAATFEAPPHALFTRSLVRAARLVVSTRRNTPYASAITQSTGRHFVAVSPDDRPPWYQPPPNTEVGRQSLARVISTS
jgi:uncharacterized protein (DUF58 family)